MFVRVPGICVLLCTYFNVVISYSLASKLHRTSHFVTRVATCVTSLNAPVHRYLLCCSVAPRPTGSVQRSLYSVQYNTRHKKQIKKDLMLTDDRIATRYDFNAIDDEE